MSVGAVPVQSDGINSTLSPVVYGDIVLSINTHYITLHDVVRTYMIQVSLTRGFLLIFLQIATYPYGQVLMFIYEFLFVSNFLSGRIFAFMYENYGTCNTKK